MPPHLRSISYEDFEYLCEAVIQKKGLAIEARPARGPDGGKDILAVRSFTDTLKVTHHERWLIECKHLAGSNRSVSERDVGNVEARMKIHVANRYLLISSTAVSETVKNQLKAISEDQGSDRKAVFWVKTDIEGYLEEFPDLKNRYFNSWEREASAAADMLQLHHSEAHRGAILWTPEVMAIFGNDGFPKPGAQATEAQVRTLNEIEKVRKLLAGKRVPELAFGTSSDGYSWVILAAKDDVYWWNDVIWDCYPKGGSSNEHQKAEAFSRIWSFLTAPIKSHPAGLPMPAIGGSGIIKT
jgi:hypothetical protein